MIAPGVPDPMIGQMLGNHRILARVSVGGMGTIYRAEHALIGRHAAVKVLHPEMSASKDIVNRFFNEAKATTAIKHPGIVEIFDFGYMPSGHAYIVMEFLDGMTLAQRTQRRGPIHEGEAAMILRNVGSALAAAHAKGIVHRDLKPDNIFVIPDPDSPLGERTKILDFGIAKLTDVGLAGSATKTGAVMGTPTYMSPEQCKGTGNVDHRADLYSLGCIFYELMTGRPPFVFEGAGELIGAHLFMQPDPPSRHAPGITPETEKLVMNLLDKLPERRVQTMRELGGMLTEIALRHGWSPNVTDLDVRISMPAMGSPFDQPTQISMPMPTPPAATVPMSFTPAPAYAPVPTPMTLTNKPTTLSGSASQTAPQPVQKKSRTGLAVTLGVAALLVGGGVAFVAVRGGSGSSTAEPAKAPLVAPAPVTPPPPVAPIPTPMPPTPPTPPTPIETAKPIAPPVEAPKPPIETEKPVPKPVTPKPVVKPKPKPKGDLIETDLDI